MRIRPGVFVLFLAISFGVARPASAAPFASVLTGVAHDSLGRALAGAEIFVRGKGIRPVSVSTRTDASGRFLLADLPPTIYELAGFKQGYLLALGRVNTLLSSSIDLLFQPLPHDDPGAREALPADRTWALRIPERSILRDEENGVATAARERDSGAYRLPAFLATIDGSLDQSFALALPGAESGGDSRLQGSETRLHLSSPLSERADLDLHGGHLRDDLGAADATGLARGASSDLLVRVTYDATDDSRVSVQSYFADRNAAPPTRAVDPSGAGRAWGWDARFTTHLDATTRLDVGLDYRDASLTLPGATAQTTADSRAVRASGTLDSIAAQKHRLQLAFAAGSAVPTEALESGGFRSLGPTAEGVPGWSVRLNAQDAWSLTGRTSVVYGIGALGPIDEGGRSPVLIPRLGGVVSRERITARLVVSYLTGAQASTVPASGSLGYDAEVQLPLANGFLLRGSASYAPALPDPAVATDGSSQRPLWLTDGNAAVRAAGVGLERTSSFGSAFARLTVGSADGSLTVLPEPRMPVHLLTDESVSFRSGTGGFRFARTGTRLEASWRSVLEDSPNPGSAAVARRTAQTSIVQDLPRSRESDLAWKLMLLYRSDRAAAADAALAGPVEEHRLGREIHAGVSMAF